MNHPKGTHDFRDGELVTGKVLAEVLGVSPSAIAQAKERGRVDTYENSKGSRRFHRDLAVEQFKANRDPTAATNPTRRQKAVGMTRAEAQADTVASVSVRNDRAVPVGLPAVTPEAVKMGIEQRPMTDEEAYDFAISRAKREHYQAALAEIKVQESAGRLVDKAEVGAKISALANSVKDRLMSLHVRVAGLMMGPLESALASGGLDPETVRTALSAGNIDRVIADTVRKELLDALRDLVDAERGLLDG